MRRTLTVCVALGVLAWSAYSCRSASAAGAFTASGGAIYVPGLGGAEAFDGTIISGPAVIKVPKSDAPGEFTYMMYYDGRIPGGPASIGLATSPDGVNWTRYSANPVLANVRDPAVVYTPEDQAAPYKAWYSPTSTGGKAQIFYATSQDGITWSGAGASLSCGGPGELDDGDIGDPWVVEHGDQYLMYYSAWSQSLADVGPAVRCMFLAVSTNGKEYRKYGPVLDGVPPPGTSEAEYASAGGIKEPAVVVVTGAQGSEFLMVYEVGGDPRTIHLARSLDGRHWAKFAGNPVMTGTGAKGSFPQGASAPSPLVETEGQLVRLWFASYKEPPIGIGLASCGLQQLTGVTQQEIDGAPTVGNLNALGSFAQGAAKAKKGLYQEAVTDLRAGIAALPKSPYARGAWMRVGDICRDNLKDTAGAVHAYQMVVQQWPADASAAQAHYNLAQIYLTDRKDPQKALSELEAVVAQWPDGLLTRLSQVQIGEVYQQYLHENEKALAAFQLVLDKWPDDPVALRALVGMGSAYGELGQYQKAIDALKTVLAKDPGGPYAPMATLLIGHNYLWMHDFEKALPQYVELQKGSVYAVEGRYYEAYCRMTLGDRDQAIEIFNRALGGGLPPKLKVRAQHMLAECYYDKSDFQSALVQLENILADASADNVEYHPAALYMKADCYRRLGRNADARTVAQALLARFPNCPYVDAARQLLKAIGPAPSS